MVRRTMAILLGLALCVSLAGCTMTAYFGGWAKVGGVVVTLDSDGTSYVPVTGVQITLTPGSDASVTHMFQSEAPGGDWASYWLKRDRYEVRFDCDGYIGVTRSVELRERWAEYDMGQIPLVKDSGSAL